MEMKALTKELEALAKTTEISLFMTSAGADVHKRLNGWLTRRTSVQRKLHPQLTSFISFATHFYLNI